MILLRKAEMPAVLRDNAEAWTATILRKQAAGEELTKADKGRYGHRDIKSAIVEETKGKCAYCESKVRHIAPGDIEHIVPKNVEPEGWFEWVNLTLACDVCNTNKGVKTGLVDPYVPDPENRFAFLGGAIYPAPGDEEANYTARVLGLNREELVGRRQERLENLIRHMEVISKTQNAELRSVLESDFRNELADDKEYAALSRSFAREMTRRGWIAEVE